MPKSAASAHVLDPAAAVGLLLTPELRLLDCLRPEAGASRRAKMSEDGYAFYRGSNAISCQWMTTALPALVPWVWAMGDAHPGNFATLAVGPRRNDDGLSSVRFDIADVDDEHPAPWCWDAVRLLAGIKLSVPKIKDFPAIVAAHLDEYRRTISDHRAGDVRWTRIDLDGLPEPLKRTISDEAAPARYDAYLKEQIDGQRIKRSKKVAACDDGEVIRAAMTRAWAREDVPAHDILDVVTRVAGGGVASRGRRRWLVLVREKCRIGGKVEHRPRVIEIKDRRPSVVSRFVAVDPFPIRDGIITVPMSLDPFHGVAYAGSGTLLARTRCHTRTPLDLSACDAGDLIRAARLYGQLLAAFHCRGLMHVGVDRGQLASADKPGADKLCEWAEGLAEHSAACHAVFKKQKH